MFYFLSVQIELSDWISATIVSCCDCTESIIHTTAEGKKANIICRLFGVAAKDGELVATDQGVFPR